MDGKTSIDAPSSAAAMFFSVLPKVQCEERVFVLPLDGSGRALAKPIFVAVGHVDGTVAIDAGAIFREALKAGAEEIIVAHNHPSGNPEPSPEDYGITRVLCAAGKIIQIPVIDHIIIGRRGITSICRECPEIFEANLPGDVKKC